MAEFHLQKQKVCDFIFRGQNVRGRNVPGRNVLAETSVAEMSVAEMSKHRLTFRKRNVGVN